MEEVRFLLAMGGLVVTGTVMPASRHIPHLTIPTDDPNAAQCVQVRTGGISPATFNNWKARLGGMVVSDARRLRQLDEENRNLKQLLAEVTFDNHVLRELLRKNASGLLPDAKPCTMSRSGGATASVAPAG